MLAPPLQAPPPPPYLPLVLPGSTTSGNGSSDSSADVRPGQPPNAVALATAVQLTETWQCAEDFPCASALSASGAAVRVQTTQARLGHALEPQRRGATPAVTS